MKRMTIAEKLTRKRVKTIQHLAYSAASMLKQDDINSTHDVKLAWENFEKIYLPEMIPIVTKLVDENKAHIFIPRTAKKLWMEA